MSVNRPVHRLTALGLARGARGGGFVEPTRGLCELLWAADRRDACQRVCPHQRCQRILIADAVIEAGERDGDENAQHERREGRSAVTVTTSDSPAASIGTESLSSPAVTPRNCRGTRTATRVERRESEVRRGYRSGISPCRSCRRR
jgi:hypothetical protein